MKKLLYLLIICATACSDGIKTIYNDDGTKRCDIDTKTNIATVYDKLGQFKGKFNNKNYILDGTWEEWDGNNKRMIWTFVNGVKEGKYQALYPDGTIEAIGYYKNGTIDDTLKCFDKKGQLIMIEFWKADADGKSSTSKNRIYLTDTKPDGTDELVDGKWYMWKNGKKEFQRNVRQ